MTSSLTHISSQSALDSGCSVTLRLARTKMKTPPLRIVLDLRSARKVSVFANICNDGNVLYFDEVNFSCRDGDVSRCPFYVVFMLIYTYSLC